MSKRAGRGRGGPKGGRGKGGRGGGDGDSRRKRSHYDDDDDWEEAPASWERMSRSERADLREFLDERARKRSHDEETAMFRRWKKYQDHADEYGDDAGYYGGHYGDEGDEPPSSSKQKQRKDSKLRKMHETVDTLETALQNSKTEQQRTKIELEQFKQFAIGKFNGLEQNGEKADNPSATIQVSKAEWDKLQNDAKRVAKEQTPDPPKREAAPKPGKSAKSLKFVFNYDEAPDDTSTADSAATSITRILKEKLQLADKEQPLAEGKFSISQKNRSVAEQLARQLAKQFDDDDYASLDALREEVSLKSTAKQTHSLLEAMLKAIVSRKVVIDPEELLPGDT